MRRGFAHPATRSAQCPHAAVRATARRRAIAGTVLVTATLVVGIDAAPAIAATTRLAGNDRYATAAAVSATSFAPGVPVVYLATGENFPDALAGGAAGTVKKGPLLLTQRDVLPAPTASELDRLDPATIRVLGGPGAVSDAVVQQLATYTTGEVRRLAAGDRYGTAIVVSQDTFAAGVPVLYVASGAGFADALAGGPAAGAAAGPVLLVESSIPPPLDAELRRLAPRAITILGGPAAVSSSVENQLRGYTSGPVGRSAGADRYETAVAVSRNAFSPGRPKVYLATGETFADSLGAGPAAGLAPGPILLVQRNCIPPTTNAEIDRLAPANLIVLGGHATLGPEIEQRVVCEPPPPPPPPPPAPVSFGDGTHRVGADIPAGTYRNINHPGCYWERLSGFSGDSDDRITNDLRGDGPTIVTIRPSDAGFHADDCGTWTNDLRSIHAPTAPLGEGMWQVGTEVAPGTWRNDGNREGCYWERLSGFTGDSSDRITNDLTDAQTIVTIKPTDVGFDSQDCGTWTKIG